MLTRLCRLCRYRNDYLLLRFNSQVSEHTVTNSVNINPKLQETEEYSLPMATKSVLGPIDEDEDISHIASYLKPTFNFAAYINKSDSLQQLLKLGVDLHRIEKNAEATQFLLGLKFEDIKDHIIFLNNLCLETEKIGNIITKNPFLLREDLDNLKVRINYLEFKKFTEENIKRIIEANPFWLSHNVQQIDKCLGFFQYTFNLTGNEVRLVTIKGPRLITASVDKVKLNLFILKEEMGFNEEELKKIILNKPLIFTKGEHRLLKTFEYLHREMNISLERIVEEPDVLNCRYKRLMERHLFLVKLGKAQYDPKKPNYVGLLSLVSGDDSHFSTEVAKSSVQAYNTFLKSL